MNVRFTFAAYFALFVLISSVYGRVATRRRRQIGDGDIRRETHGVRYKYFSTPKTFDAAKAACESVEGGTLAIIDSSSVNQEIVNIKRGHWVWIGLYEQSGSWKSTCHKSISYNGWDPGQPEDNGEHCALMLSTSLHDYPCSELHNYVCQYKNRCAGRKFLTRFCQNGGTCVESACSEPTCRCAFGWSGSNCETSILDYGYIIFNDEVSREEAERRCHHNNAKLATITSNEEFDFLEKHLTPGATYWIGAKATGCKKVANCDKWFWEDGEPLPLKWKHGWKVHPISGQQLPYDNGRQDAFALAITRFKSGTTTFINYGEHGTWNFSFICKVKEELD